MPPEVEPNAALFRRLFEAEAGYVWLTLRRLGVREADVEDLAHELFMKAYGKLNEYDDTRAAKPWLFAFAFRVASEYRRTAKHKYETLGDPPDVPSEAPAADQLLAAQHERALLSAALASVDLDRRAVLVAHEMDEIPMKDVAVSLEIPLNTAYSRLRVGREELARAFVRLQSKGSAQ
jgi:RNA polymerase sigma-70 factor (ECF subfamily)